MLADVLSSKYEVRIIGFLFEKYGSSLWEPLKNSSIPLHIYRGNSFPDFNRILNSIALENKADLIIVSKPRLPSMQLGLIMKSIYNLPLILDIDDYEIAFVKDSGFRKSDLMVPYGGTWTRYSERLIDYAENIFVSNIALQEKYGGTIIPHVRDEEIFFPQLYNRKQRRKELGLPVDDKIVLFLGTPRKHKGLLKLLEGVKQCGDPSYKLCIIGSFPDQELKEYMQSMGGESLLLLPDQPFEDIASNTVIADLVCILQDQDSEIARYQLPAKVIDAIAMAVPVLATPIRPLEPFIKQGLVFPTTESDLTCDLHHYLDNSGYYQEKQLDKREIFLREYSYSSAFSKMERIIEDAIQSTRSLPGEALNYVNLQTDLIEEVDSMIQPYRDKLHNIEKGYRETRSEFRKKLQKKDDELKTIAIKLEQLILDYNQLLSSKSWRYTRPLRKIGVYYLLVKQKLLRQLGN